MLNSADQELIRDLWVLREREDLLLDCFDYVDEHKSTKPIVICAVHFLQQAISMNGLSTQDLRDMEQDYMDKIDCGLMEFTNIGRKHER